VERLPLVKRHAKVIVASLVYLRLRPALPLFIARCLMILKNSRPITVIVDLFLAVLLVRLLMWLDPLGEATRF
jgi:hypothetical protein